jgi:hypothetical protein
MGTHLRGIGLAAAIGLLAAGCGSSSPSSPSNASDGPIAATLTITAAGISPKTNTVAVGSRITIVNNDSVAHEMDSDPHPEHNECPQLNIGTLLPGQSRSSQNLPTARTCGMHDHSDPDNDRWKTTITVQ